MKKAIVKAIVLAVDVQSHISAAVGTTRDLCRDSGDTVIVLHVHEFAVGLWGRMQLDCGEGQGEALVDKIVADLRSAGITAKGEIREAQFGNIAGEILSAGENRDARIIVLGSCGRADLPYLPLGSVSHRLLHVARRPVLIVPHRFGTKPTELQPGNEATAC